MLPELGNFAVMLAFSLALVQGTVPAIGLKRKSTSLIAIASTAALAQWLMLMIAFVILIKSLVDNDITVLYVLNQVNASLPLLYRIGAAWGGHEGSLLFWCLLTSTWTLGFALLRQRLKKHTSTYILVVLGWLNAGYILFLLTTSNPFVRFFPTVPIKPLGLTPVLQDPGLLFHPPLLYLGYVGFIVGFAFAIAALIEGKLDKDWCLALRPWIALSWVLLTIGIVVGSWWAYRELGWGGWWAWDPVENASLLPWLAATALLHSLFVSEINGEFKGWTILLTILCFALSLLGTFLVRSGVLVSVHTFALDPKRGIFLLLILAVIFVSAMLLYMLRMSRMTSPHYFKLLSKQTFLLLNTVIILVAIMTILLGTLYPIVLESIGLGRISVGAPYYNVVFIPIIVPLLLIMGLGPITHYQQDALSRLRNKLLPPLLISLGVTTMVIYSLPGFHWMALLGIFLAIWLITSTALSLRWPLNLRQTAMVLAHAGIAIVILAITITSNYSISRFVKISAQEPVILGQTHVTLTGQHSTHNANFTANILQFSISETNKPTLTVNTALREYPDNQSSLMKPGINYNFWRDIYIAIGNAYDDGSYAVRLYVKPFVRWIWLGGLLVALGGLLTVIRGYREDK